MSKIKRFIHKNGLQYVLPYYRNVFATVKNKWVGKTIIEVMKNDFIGRDLLNYEKMINSYQLYLKRNNIIVKGSKLFELKLNKLDVISNPIHVHELPVPIPSLKKVFEDDNLLVINKPAGIPVHPSKNSYRFNSVVSILSKNQPDILVSDSLMHCHRLDKDTSGVLILSKNKKANQEMIQLISDKNKVTKKYIARVIGEFPNNELVCNDPIVFVDLAKKFDANGKGKIWNGETIFEKISYNKSANQSIVSCILKTGRRHQIRIHLRNLGFPIVNDSLFGLNGILSEKMTSKITKKQFDLLRIKYENKLKERENWTIENTCNECGKISYKDPNTRKFINLHALEYKATDGSWSFKSELPEWAKETL